MRVSFFPLQPPHIQPCPLIAPGVVWLRGFFSQIPLALRGWLCCAFTAACCQTPRVGRRRSGAAYGWRSAGGRCGMGCVPSVDGGRRRGGQAVFRVCGSLVCYGPGLRGSIQPQCRGFGHVGGCRPLLCFSHLGWIVSLFILVRTCNLTHSKCVQLFHATMPTCMLLYYGREPGVNPQHLA